jgi:hypothetical protein
LSCTARERSQRILARLLKEIPVAVRAKVHCESIENNAVTFRTVCEPDATKDTENARFTKATPWGKIKLGIDNPAALEQFVPGMSYYVDFTPAE